MFKNQVCAFLQFDCYLRFKVTNYTSIVNKSIEQVNITIFNVPSFNNQPPKPSLLIIDNYCDIQFCRGL